MAEARGSLVERLEEDNSHKWRSCRAQAAFVFFLRCLDNFFQKQRCEGAGRIGWSCEQVRTLAKAALANLPATVHDLVLGDEWKGGDVVLLDSALVRPGANDVAVNFFFLKPILESSPDKVPRLISLSSRFSKFQTSFHFTNSIRPMPDNVSALPCQVPSGYRGAGAGPLASGQVVAGPALKVATCGR